ncbi:Serine/arginine-rich splicing factor 9 [Saguinus oedipus]|uniref:Serine/arginine-rich splicing factor 9 n=1 Tax=Saguinus oedipus TaxID=9490 RepID=A0ABQ9WFV7_SAGOE|nr:Serine/arginine-rich splicing factor 9 [Saguinus oedipus]
MQRMKFMEGMVMIMASVGFVWRSPGLMEADVQKDGVGMVEYLRKEDIDYVLHKLDDTKFRSHEGETSYIGVYPGRSTSYGYSQTVSVWVKGL